MESDSEDDFTYRMGDNRVERFPTNESMLRITNYQSDSEEDKMYPGSMVDARVGRRVPTNESMLSITGLPSKEGFMHPGGSDSRYSDLTKGRSRWGNPTYYSANKKFPEDPQLAMQTFVEALKNPDSFNDQLNRRPMNRYAVQTTNSSSVRDEPAASHHSNFGADIVPPPAPIISSYPDFLQNTNMGYPSQKQSFMQNRHMGLPDHLIASTEQGSIRNTTMGPSANTGYWPQATHNDVRSTTISPSVNEVAMVCVPDGTGSVKYPAPDPDLLTFDPAIGYRYDARTGLHYDANSGYFFNSKLKIFLQWDFFSKTYLRVEKPLVSFPVLGNEKDSSESDSSCSHSGSRGDDRGRSRSRKRTPSHSRSDEQRKRQRGCRSPRSRTSPGESWRSLRNSMGSYSPRKDNRYSSSSPKRRSVSPFPPIRKWNSQRRSPDNDRRHRLPRSPQRRQTHSKSPSGRSKKHSPSPGPSSRRNNNWNRGTSCDNRRRRVSRSPLRRSPPWGSHSKRREERRRRSKTPDRMNRVKSNEEMTEEALELLLADEDGDEVGMNIPDQFPVVSSQPAQTANRRDHNKGLRSSLPSLFDVPVPRMSSLPSLFDVPVPRVSSLPSTRDVPVPRVSSLPSTRDVPVPRVSSLPSTRDVPVPSGVKRLQKSIFSKVPRIVPPYGAVPPTGPLRKALLPTPVDPPTGPLRKALLPTPVDPPRGPIRKALLPTPVDFKVAPRPPGATRRNNQEPGAADKSIFSKVPRILPPYGAVPPTGPLRKALLPTPVDPPTGPLWEALLPTPVDFQVAPSATGRNNQELADKRLKEHHARSPARATLTGATTRPYSHVDWDESLNIPYVPLPTPFIFQQTNCPVGTVAVDIDTTTPPKTLWQLRKHAYRWVRPDPTVNVAPEDTKDGATDTKREDPTQTAIREIRALRKTAYRWVRPDLTVNVAPEDTKDGTADNKRKTPSPTT